MKERVVESLSPLIDLLIDRWRLFQFHPHTLLMQQAQAEAAEYVRAHMRDALGFRRHREFLLFALSKAPKEGLVAEFGVASGSSIRLVAGATSRQVHGFDSFEGLPEDWAGRHEPKGAYSTKGLLPDVPANVVLHKGWFDQTLPRFLKENPGHLAFLHVDCDLYSSTQCVLGLLASRIVPGTVIVFDEYFNYASWRDNEHKAFQEFVAAHQVEYRYIGWAYQQVAVVVQRIRENNGR